jgi:hypothetical protein
MPSKINKLSRNPHPQGRPIKLVSDGVLTFKVFEMAVHLNYSLSHAYNILNGHCPNKTNFKYL